MTNLESPNNNGSVFSKVFQFIQQPHIQIITGTVLISLGIMGYTGLKFLVNEFIPEELEKILNETLEREVKIGKISSFSLNHVTIEKSLILATDTDSSNLEIKKIDIDFNLLPLIFNKNLPLNISIDNITGFIQIDTLGESFKSTEESQPIESLKLPSLPITLDINLQLKESELEIQANSKTKPLIINSLANIHLLYDVANQPLEYKLQANLGNGNIEIKGKTFLATGESNNHITIESLDLPKIASAIDNIPCTLNQGEINADFNLIIPSLEEISDFNLNGVLTAENIQAKLSNSHKIKALEKPLIVNALLGFNQQTITIEEAKTNIGDIDGNIQGYLDLQGGVDLGININPIRISKLLPQIPVKLPVNADGLVTASLKVGGDILNPIVKGNIKSKNTIIDKVALGNIQADFQGNLSEVILEKLEVKPKAGGEFVATGLVKTNIKETIASKGQIDIMKMPFNLNFKTTLPTEKFISPYYDFPDEITIGNVFAKGQLTGNLEKPQGILEFNLPQVVTSSLEKISGKGKLILVDNKLRMTNTEFVTNKGKIKVNGVSDFKSKKWQASLVASQINLTPFVTKFCETSSSCLQDEIDFTRPIKLYQSNVELKGNLENTALNSIEGKINLALNINEGTLIVNSTLKKGTIQAEAKARQIPLTNLFTTIPLNTTLISSDINIHSTVNDLLSLNSLTKKIPSSLQITADTKLAVEEGIVEANTNLNSESTNIIASGHNIYLDKILPSASTKIETTTINVSAKTQELFALAKMPFNFNNFSTLNSLNVDTHLQLEVGAGKIDGNVSLNSNLVKITGITNNISPADIVSSLPIKANKVNAQLNLNANLPELLAFGTNYLENKNLIKIPSLNVATDIDMELAKGKVSLKANLENNQWQANIDTNEIDTKILSQQLSLFSDKEKFEIPNLNAKLNLSGNLNSFANVNQSILIQAESINVNLGGNAFSANGNLTLINLLTKPDISNLQLNVNANTDLGSLPLNSVWEKLTKNNTIFPQEINILGKGEFKGNIRGKSLLSNPLGKDNLAIRGSLNLENFSLNNSTKFEPLLIGSLTIIPAEEISINLAGQEDVIVVKIIAEDWTIPKTNLTMPYVLDSLEIRKGGEEGFIVEGKRENNQLIASITNFPLEVFEVNPLKNYGILGAIKGNVNGKLAINLLDLTTRGRLAVKNPELGNIKAKEIVSNFSYKDNLAQLEEAYLKFAESEYSLEGGINLATGEINGKLNLEGDVRDIFDTIKISDINTIATILQKIQTRQPFDNANQLTSTSVGNDNNTIKEQLNLFYNIEQEIKKIARKIEAGKIPNELEIIGRFAGEITLAGTIKSPQINVNVEGKNWQWLPHESFPNIVQSLGFVLQTTQSIAIPKILIKGDFKDKQINIDAFNFNIGKSEIFFAGNLSNTTQAGEFKIQDLSLDLIKNFLPFPLDIAGDINLNGKLKGNLINPEIQGNVSLSNIAVEGQILDKDIAGNFAYDNHTLNFNTASPSEIKIEANIPYHPFVETETPATINIDLDTEAIALLGVLSKGQIELSGGEAKANLQIEIASINNLINNLSNPKFSLETLMDDIDISGNLNLEDTKLTSVALVNPLTVTGKVILLNDKKGLKVEKINAKIKDTEINIAGILPLVKPINNNPNPLEVKINEQNLNLKGLYNGNIAANINIVGTALQPKIQGNLSLEKASLSIPNKVGIQQIENVRSWQKWLGNVSTKTAGIFKPKLHNFQINLASLELAQWGFYRVNFDGNLAVNGNLLDLENLKANGAINLNRGEIYIGGSLAGTSLPNTTSVSQTTFFLSRAYQNQIRFNGQESILNPKIDLQVEADISDYSSQLPPLEGNEIPEPISRSNQAETIRVMLNINGNAEQILPNLVGNTEKICAFYGDNPIPNDSNFSEQKLTKVAQCINLNNLKAQGTNLGILNSSIVNLSSIPARSQGELINLIVGGELLKLAEQLQDLSGDQLFERGIVQFILVPLAQNVSFSVNDKVSSWGQPLGMKDLRVFPLVEGVYEIEKKKNVSVSYDYFFNEFKIRYQVRF